ncbi:hypothetical protein [Tsukamurella hominis]|uniref:hypothetical protein n=1 Tax=Tsukamurella hominis TaxID=1970232 RepID=UPI0039EB3A02
MADENAGVRPTQAGEDRMERIRKLVQAASGQPYRVGGGEDDQADGGEASASSAEKPSD